MWLNWKFKSQITDQPAAWGRSKDLLKLTELKNHHRLLQNWGLDGPSTFNLLNVVISILLLTSIYTLLTFQKLSKCQTRDDLHCEAESIQLNSAEAQIEKCERKPQKWSGKARNWQLLITLWQQKESSSSEEVWRIDEYKMKLLFGLQNLALFHNLALFNGEYVIRLTCWQVQRIFLKFKCKIKNLCSCSLLP